jgi:DNA-binding MarR family transcriptional regulator
VTSGPGLSYIIARVDRAVRHEIERISCEYGLTQPQYTALSVLAQRDGLSNAQLARRTFVRPQSMNQVVTSLEDSGLITRTPDANHRRILRTTLTDAGRRILDKCNAEVSLFEERMVRNLTSAQRKDLIDGLIECVAQLNEMEEVKQRP